MANGEGSGKTKSGTEIPAVSYPDSQSPTKRREGRPEKYKPEYVEQGYRLCLIGLKDTELADFFEVAESTLHLWKQAHPEFSESLKAGKLIADGDLTEKLYKRAFGYNHEEEKIFCNDGEVTKVKTTKHYPPDTTALIFWLKNRQGKYWKERHEVKHEGELVVLNFDKADEDL